MYMYINYIHVHVHTFPCQCLKCQLPKDVVPLFTSRLLVTITPLFCIHVHCTCTYMYIHVHVHVQCTCTWRDVTVVWIRLLSCLLYTCTVHCTWGCVTAAFVVCLMYIFWQINKIIPTVTYHPSFVPQDDDQMQADKLAVSTCMTLFCTCVCMCSFNLSSYMYTCTCIYIIYTM